MSVHDLTVALLAAKCKPVGTVLSLASKRFKTAREPLRGQSFQPDLWWQDKQSGTITCIEVEDGTHLSEEKLLAYADIAFSPRCHQSRLGSAGHGPLGQQPDAYTTWRLSSRFSRSTRSLFDATHTIELCIVSVCFRA